MNLTGDCVRKIILFDFYCLIGERKKWGRTSCHLRTESCKSGATPVMRIYIRRIKGSRSGRHPLQGDLFLSKAIAVL